MLKQKNSAFLAVAVGALVLGAFGVAPVFAQQIATPGAACTGPNAYFWEQSSLCNGATWQRPAFQFGASTSQTCNSGLAGMLQWTSTAASPNNTLEYCNGSSWTAFAGASSGILLGTSATANNPQVSGDATTGLFSAAASTVSVATAGVEALRVTATQSVGVGTTTPTQKLDVAGVVNTSTAYYLSGTIAYWHSAADGNLAVGPTNMVNTVVAGTGTGNVAIGPQALNVTTTGYASTAVGYQALSAQVNGNLNTAVGYKALAANISGTSNTAVGYKALAANTTQTQNTAVGESALAVSTSGYQNTGIGHGAMTHITSGSANTALGYTALNTATAAWGTTAIGSQSMRLFGGTATTGNTALGTNSMYGGSSTNSTGSNNTSLGANSGYNLTTGSSNSFLGYATATNVSTGSSNTILGAGAGSTLTTGSSNIVIGASADVTASNTSNQLNIGNVIYGDLSGARLGIGSATINSGASLDMSSRTDSLLLPTGTSGARPTAAVGMMRYNTTTNAVEAYQGGSPAWTSLSGGAGASTLGTTATNTSPYATGDVTTGLFSVAASTVSVATAGVEALRVTATQSVGVGTTTPTQKVGVSGSVDVSGAYYLSASQVVGVPSVDLGNTSLAVGWAALNALQNTSTAYNNTAIGFEAMKATTTGFQNTAVGYQALLLQNAGNGNTAVGYLALKTVTGGFYNTAVGAGALKSNTGSQNVAVGSNAVSSNTSGQQNVGVGHGALGNNQGGNNNIAIGYSANINATAGSGTTAIGNNAMTKFTTSGSTGNVAVGFSAMYGATGSSTGTNDTALGYQALMNIQTGTNNLALGYNVGPTLTTGSSNILIGTSSAVDVTAAGSSNQLNIGNLIYGDLTNKRLSIGSATINSGASLDMSSRTDSLLLPTGTSGARPTPTVGMIRYNSTTNAFEVYQGASPAWSSMASATSGLILGTSTAATNPQATGDVTTGLFSAAASTVSVATAGVEVLRVTATQSVGIGTTTPQQKLDVNGNINVSAITNGYYLAGNKALFQPASDTSSLAVGRGALAAQTATNLNNTAVGGVDPATSVGPLAQVTSGAENVAIGSGAGGDLTGGTYNILIGNEAGYSMGNSSTDANVAIGQQAGTVANLGWGHNVLIGYLAGYQGNYLYHSVAIGDSAGHGVSSTYSVLLGDYAGLGLNGGTNTNNVIIGSSAGGSNAGVSNAIAIGAGVLVSATNQINIGNAIYGDAVTGVVGVGSGSFHTGVSLDVGNKTDSLLLPTGTSGQRPSGTVGMMRYNSTTNSLEVYQGPSPSWVTMTGSGGSVSTTLGANATNASPYASGDATTGLFSAAASSVSVATAGLEVLRVTATQSVGVGTTTPKVSVDLSAKTDALLLQSGTTGQRPTGVVGMIRYNSTTSSVEAYQGASPAWTSLGSGSGGVTAPINLGSGTTVDWSSGYVAYTTANCGAFTFSNMSDGGTYTLAVLGTTSGTCSFTHSGLTIKLPPTHGASIAGTYTLYTFVRMGTNVFTSWVPGY